MPFILGVSFGTIVLEGIFISYSTWKTTDTNDILFETVNMKKNSQIFLAKKIFTFQDLQKQYTFIL